jgi:hypothetical protein
VYADGLRAELLLAELAYAPVPWPGVARVATARDRSRIARLRYRLIAIDHPERVPHGTSTGYSDYACRCPECLEAGHRVAMRRAERRAASGGVA